MVASGEVQMFLLGMFERAYEFKEVEIDFGSNPVSEASFVITDAECSTDSLIIIAESGNPGTGKDADEPQLDVIVYKGVSGFGQFTVYGTCLTGVVSGKFKINYLLKKGYTAP